MITARTDNKMKHNLTHGHTHPARPATRPSAPAPTAPRRGLVLPLVLLAMSIAVILGMCFLTSASTATTLSTAADHRLRARMIAESGLATALAYIEAEPTWRAQRGNGVWVTSQALDGGTFTISGEDGDRIDAAGAVVGDGNLVDDPNDPVVLTSVGEYQGVRHRVRAVRSAPKMQGIAVNERVEVKNSAVVDSYNPELGPYSAAIATARGLAQSNGAARAPYVRLRNRARVNGDVYFGRDSTLGGAVIRDGTAVVTGTIAPLPASILTPTVVEPDWANSGGMPTSYSSAVTIVNTDTWYKRLELKGNATLRVLGDVRMYVHGPMTVTDDARIEIGAPMAHGASIKGSITINSTVAVDSYDSSLGTYGGTNVGAKAVLATNSTAVAAVTISSILKGDAYSGVGSDPLTSIVVTGSVSGQRAALTTPITIPPPPPWPTDVPANSGYYEVKDIVRTLSTNLQTDNLRITGNGILRVDGHRTIRVNGTMILDGNGQIEIGSNSSLTMYVGGKITMSGNGSAANTSTAAPERLIIYGMGSGLTHEVLGNSIMHGIIDSPNSAVYLDGNGKVYGAIMASSLRMLNNAELHNDRNPALVTANPRLAATYTPGSRLTLYTNHSVNWQKRARINAGTMNPLIARVFHLGPAPMNVTEDVIANVTAVVPASTLSISGAARWTGRIDARHLMIGGTAIVTADASGGTARPALLVEETVEIRDDAIVNATGGTALLASRGSTDITIWATDNAVFNGSGYSAPGGNPASEIRVGAAATFTGTKNALAYPLSIAALTAPAASGAVTDRIISGTTTATLSGDVFCDNFEIHDDALVEVEQDTRLMVAGNFRLLDNARLVLRPGVRLTVHCGGWVQIAGNARVNVEGDAHPRRLTISCPTALRIDVRDSARLCATVLAPLAELKLIQSAEFSGAFIGRRAKIEGDARFHCAQAIPGPITWIEQE
ncbi:MAG TPA: hypothetical protein VGR35_12265 [Tepidisphaeraceae bacterium]|nr:hypothetical protein [Tepidisphaeraceae bacterium]